MSKEGSSSTSHLKEDNSVNTLTTVDFKSRIILVCYLCLRQYDLVEDLRGHMIEYHKYRPVEEEEEEEQSPKLSAEATKNEANIEISSDENRVKDVNVPLPETLAATVTVPDSEVKPMPFKDFRLVLRSNMSLKCNKYNSCIYKFETEDKLQQHIKCHTADKASFTCFLCSMTLENWRRCSAHLWKAHEIDVDLLKCLICDYKSHASALVWRHMRVHKKWRPRVMRSLKAIKNRRLEALKQQSEEVSAATEVAAKTTQVTPRKNKYYSEKTCEICERKFVNGKTLSKHIKTVHNKIKPFICNVCGKKTARKASLIIHMRQHTGEKPLTCKSCKFSTRDPSVLHKHQLRHEGSGKLKCSLCDYTCIQANALKRHIRLNHSELYKRLSCDLCSFVTINETKLKAHKDDHRKGLIVNNEDSMAGRKMIKNSEASTDCFLPLESIDSLPHEPAVDTGGVTIPAPPPPPPTEDSQFPTYLNN